MIYQEPLEDLLRAFYFNSSAYSPSGFYLEAFVQPLYIPSSYITFTVCKRVGGGAKFWDLQGSDEATVMGRVLAAIETEGLPFLSLIETPADFAARAIELTGAPDSIHLIDAVAHSAVLAGDY